MGKRIIKYIKMPLRFIGVIADWMELKDTCNYLSFKFQYTIVLICIGIVKITRR